MWRQGKKLIASDLFIHSLSISFLMEREREMPSIILQVTNLFEEKENNPTLPLVAPHLGKGNTCLIKLM
jgi:hypothetical protein